VIFPVCLVRRPRHRKHFRMFQRKRSNGSPSNDSGCDRLRWDACDLDGSHTRGNAGSGWVGCGSGGSTAAARGNLLSRGLGCGMSGLPGHVRVAWSEDTCESCFDGVLANSSGERTGVPASMRGEQQPRRSAAQVKARRRFLSRLSRSQRTHRRFLRFPWLDASDTDSDINSNQADPDSDVEIDTRATRTTSLGWISCDGTSPSEFSTASFRAPSGNFQLPGEQSDGPSSSTGSAWE